MRLVLPFAWHCGAAGDAARHYAFSIGQETAFQHLAGTAQRDIDAVRNAITVPWSNGETEGQINRLKALKRAMYGRTGSELLPARLLPL
jgi:transposase